jgi:ADP-ribosylation factor-like protein 1
LLKSPLHCVNLLHLQESDLEKAILLVFANKQDAKGALNAAQIGEAMNLAAIKDRQWSIAETSAAAGKGLHEGFDWLVGAINAAGK